MPTKTTTAQEEATIQQQALEQLAILGGKLTRAEDIIFQGTKFVLPAHLDLRKSIEFLEERETAEEERNRFTRSFPYRPFDGAHALEKAIREACGFMKGKTLRSFFGSRPPEFIDIPVSHFETAQVPWGAMTMPGLPGVTIYLDTAMDPNLGSIFNLIIEGPLKYRDHYEGLFRLVDKYLKQGSIYRGKAITADCEFIDTTTVDPTKLVYSDSVTRRLEGDLWAFIRYEGQLAEFGQDGKYAVLLEGPYGSGKTEAAGITAQIANDHGWTFITAKAGKDQLTKALQLARLYEPAVVFGEDVDLDANPQSKGSAKISQILDQMDGFHVKGQKLVAVFTTNNAERIHAGMLRPGRIGAVIHVGAMDRPGVEKLARRIIGEALDDDVDFDAVFKSMDGYMPAYVREAFNRAIRYTIAANKGHMGKIGTEQLCDAADGLRDQLRLMEAAPRDRTEETLSGAFKGIALNAAMEAIDGVEVRDHDGDTLYFLRQ